MILRHLALALVSLLVATAAGAQPLPGRAGFRPGFQFLGVTAALAPRAPTLAADQGSGQVRLRITDDPASTGVRKWGIYRAPTAGGALTFVQWAYNPADVRVFQANGSTIYYRVSSWNAVGEGPLSAEIVATAASTTPNALRLIATNLFAGTLFYEQIGGDFLSGSTVSVTSSDGTTLSTKIQTGSILLYGTFATPGQKTLTFVETLSGGATSTSTQVITVSPRPVANRAALAATALALKARAASAPTYADAPIALTDTGATMPAGYVGSHVYHPGGSILPPSVYTAVGSFQPAQFTSTSYDPVERKAVVQYSGRFVGNNAVIRQRLFRQTFVIGVNGDGGGAVGHFVARYSDDNRVSWKEGPDPFFVRGQSGAHYVKVDPGLSVPAGGRIWELEFSSYTYLTDSASVLGMGYEAGETPQAVADVGPVATVMTDSFANGVGAMVQSRNMGRRATRALGLANFWNAGIPSHRWTLPGTSTYPLGINRVGDNVLGVGDLDMPPRLDVIFANITINDFGQSDFVQAQAMFTNALLRMRRIRPAALIVLTLGFWAPQDRIGTPLYNAIRSAYADAGDVGMIFNDGIAAGWAVPAGGTGSSPYFFAQNAPAVTGSVSGTTLTISAGSGAEVGQYLTSSSGTFLAARLYKQISGAAGGPGTYQLDVGPTVGDIAPGTSLTLASENYGATYPVHPNPPGQIWAGDRLADGAGALIARASTFGAALTTESGSPLTTEGGAPLIAE